MHPQSVLWKANLGSNPLPQPQPQSPQRHSHADDKLPPDAGMAQQRLATWGWLRFSITITSPAPWEPWLGAFRFFYLVGVDRLRVAWLPWHEAMRSPQSSRSVEPGAMDSSLYWGRALDSACHVAEPSCCSSTPTPLPGRHRRCSGVNDAPKKLTSIHMVRCLTLF